MGFRRTLSHDGFDVLPTLCGVNPLVFVNMLLIGEHFVALLFFSKPFHFSTSVQRDRRLHCFRCPSLPPRLSLTLSLRRMQPSFPHTTPGRFTCSRPYSSVTRSCRAILPRICSSHLALSSRRSAGRALQDQHPPGATWFDRCSENIPAATAGDL